MAAASQLSLPPATVSKFVNSDSARRGIKKKKKKPQRPGVGATALMERQTAFA